ncbi:Radial spokehead-like protein like protein, partial [Aduncisulcus paluster]
MEQEIFDAAKQYLEQKGPDGKSLFDHLSDVILKLFSERPDNPYDSFEAISSDIKNMSVDTSLKEEQTPAQLSSRVLSTIKTSLSLYKKPPPKLDEDGEPIEDEEDGEVPVLPDLPLQNQYLNIVGRGISPLEAQRILMAMQRFAKEKGESVTKIRFFGKFTCVNGFYYVLEGKKTNWDEEDVEEEEDEEEDGPSRKKKIINDFGAHEDLSEPEEVQKKNPEEEEEDKEKSEEEEEEEEEEEDGEPRKKKGKITFPLPPPLPPLDYDLSTPSEVHKGVNAVTYWVSKNLGEEWLQLPEITPTQIEMSRFIRRKLSGNLWGVVWKRYPRFPGREAQYLRCLIARIRHACAVEPILKKKQEEPKDDLAELDKEDENEDEEEEIIQIDEDLVQTLDGWRHIVPVLLQEGRIRASKKKKPVNEDGEEEEEEEEEEDEEEEEEEEGDEENILSKPSRKKLPL